MRTSTPRFAAFVEPRAVHAFRYRLDRDGIEVLRHVSTRGDFQEPEGAAAALAELVLHEDDVTLGGRGHANRNASVAAAIRGFGVRYALLTLPRADEDVLRLVVEREMKRLHPDVEDPVVDFAVGGSVERRAHTPGEHRTLDERRQTDTAVPPVEILAATAPAGVVRTFAGTLARHGMTLRHLTVPARALSRLYAEVNGTPDTNAVALMLPGGPLVAMFHNSEMRFVTEPPSPMHDSAAEMQTVIDQVSRGRMYLRQQFRGADITRVLLAAPTDEHAHLDGALAAVLEVDVIPLPGSVGPPAAMAALGAALDAESPDHLTFHPPAGSRRLAARQSRLRQAVLVTSFVCAAALGWALFNVVAAHRAVSQLGETRRATATAVASMQAIGSVVVNRSDNAERLRAIATLAAERRTLARALRGVGTSAGAGVDVSRVAVQREATQWRAQVTGTARGASAAQALRAISQMQRELPRFSGATDVQIAEFEQPEDESVVRFSLTFATPAMAPAEGAESR